MARVNHKLVKQRLNEKRSKITDRQFFTSRLLAGHFEDMAAAQTRRYKYNRRVHVIEDGLAPLDDGGNSSGKQNISSEEGGRIPYHQTDTLYAPEGGTTEYDADYQRQKYDKAASDIEILLEKMAERAAC